LLAGLSSLEMCRGWNSVDWWWCDIVDYMYLIICDVLYVSLHTLFQVTNDCRLFSITFCLIFRNTLEISASEDRCFKELTFVDSRSRSYLIVWCLPYWLHVYLMISFRFHSGFSIKLFLGFFEIWEGRVDIWLLYFIFRIIFLVAYHLHENLII